MTLHVHVRLSCQPLCKTHRHSDLSTLARHGAFRLVFCFIYFIKNELASPPLPEPSRSVLNLCTLCNLLPGCLRVTRALTVCAARNDSLFHVGWWRLGTRPKKKKAKISPTKGIFVRSVFPTEGFLRPRTQVRGFGRKLNVSDVFFQVQFDTASPFRATEIKIESRPFLFLTITGER